MGEWSHQLRTGNRARTTFTTLQLLAPTVVAVATILAGFSATSDWAVIPSAIATVLTTLLAAFGLRGIWFLRKRLRHELGQEVIEFIKDVGAYRSLDEADRIDRLMGKVREATMASGPAN